MILSISEYYISTNKVPFRMPVKFCLSAQDFSVRCFNVDASLNTLTENQGARVLDMVS